MRTASRGILYSKVTQRRGGIWASPWGAGYRLASRGLLRRVAFSAMRKPPKNRQRRGLPPPCGIHPAFLGCEELLPRPGRRAFAIPRGKAALLFLVAAGVVRHSLVFGPTCGAPRPTAAGPGRFPRPEALVEGAGTASGAEIAQRYAQPSNQPHQAQGRLEPRPGTKHKNMGFPKGSPFGGSLVTFCPSESNPSGAKNRLAGSKLTSDRGTSPPTRPSQGAFGWGNAQNILKFQFPLFSRGGVWYTT